jgi:hypothetical protein
MPENRVIVKKSGYHTISATSFSIYLLVLEKSWRSQRRVVEVIVKEKFLKFEKAAETPCHSRKNEKGYEVIMMLWVLITTIHGVDLFFPIPY